jgi:hypothetical protein
MSRSALPAILFIAETGFSGNFAGFITPVFRERRKRMFTKTARRTLLAALALTLCLLPVVAQAGGMLQISRGKARTVALRVQEGEGRIFNFLWKRLVGVWQKEGASIDPNGGGTTNNGASIDPSGAPNPNPPSGNGG